MEYFNKNLIMLIVALVLGTAKYLGNYITSTKLVLKNGISIKIYYTKDKNLRFWIKRI